MCNLLFFHPAGNNKLHLQSELLAFLALTAISGGQHPLATFIQVYLYSIILFMVAGNKEELLLLLSEQINPSLGIATLMTSSWFSNTKKTSPHSYTTYQLLSLLSQSASLTPPYTSQLTENYNNCYTVHQTHWQRSPPAPFITLPYHLKNWYNLQPKHSGTDGLPQTTNSRVHTKTLRFHLRKQEVICKSSHLVGRNNYAHFPPYSARILKNARLEESNLHPKTDVFKGNVYGTTLTELRTTLNARNSSLDEARKSHANSSHFAFSEWENISPNNW